MDSPEVSSLKNCYPTLVSCIQQAPDDIATQLVPLDLLPQRVFSTLSNSQKNNDEKARDILDTVLFQVQTDSSVFQSFIAALMAAGPWTKSTVNELQKEFNSYSARSSTTNNAASTYEQSQQPTPLLHTELPTNVVTGGSLSLDDRITAPHSHLQGIQILVLVISYSPHGIRKCL